MSVYLFEAQTTLFLFSSSTPYRTSSVYWIVSDRYVILSVNDDGIAVALELARILDTISSAHNWRPRRSLVFCVSLVSWDVCPQTFPAFTWRKVVAYVAVHGRLVPGLAEFLLFPHYNIVQRTIWLSASSQAALSGSDIMRSIAVEAIKTIPGDNNWTYLEHEVFGPRLPLDVPQVIFAFVSSLVSGKDFVLSEFD